MSLIPFRTLFDDNYGHDWLVHDPWRENFFKGMTTAGGNDLTKSFSPLLTMDVVENETNYKVMADLPGVDPSDLDVTVEGHSIVMKAERKHQHETNTDTVHRLERSYGSVKRKLLLPKNADMDHVETHFTNGVLTLTVPKKAEAPATSRKLAINTGTSKA